MQDNQLTRSSAQRPGVGIVHLGLGAFYRAFGAVYVADAMAASGGDWGIVGVSLKRPAIRDALAPQKFAYQIVSQEPERESVRVMEVLEDVLVAPEDPQAVLAQMADPGIRIVSLTVTEKGYCHNPATGELDLENPDIQHDIEKQLPVTAPGYLVRALQQRRAAGNKPFTILTCDNLPDNGRLVQAMVVALARRIDGSLADWIEEHARFPATMVDRITPATTDADIKRVAQLTGVYDAAPVLCEPFRQWVIEDNFVDGERPDLGLAGAELVDDVNAYEHMKLRMLNGTHSSLAYLGYLAGYETISQTVANEDFAAFVRALWSEDIIPAVDAPAGVSLKDYADALFERYANPAIRHRTWQIAMDGSQKLPQRILGTITSNLEHGSPSSGLCLTVAAWMRYVGGIDERGAAIDVKDPLAGRLRTVCESAASDEDRVRDLLAITEVFPSSLAQALLVPVTSAYVLLARDGAQKAVRTAYAD